jgi:DNA-binding CsgD family transcriptional regulator
MYGHAVTVAIFNPSHKYRDDTVNENDKLSYQGVPRGNGEFGEGEKWDDPNKAHARFLSVIILIIIASGIPVTIITIRIVTDKRFKKIRMEYSTPRIDYVGLNFTGREKEICELLLTDCSINDIAGTLKIKSSSVNFHIQNLYRKLDIQSRTELFVKLGTKKNEKEA